MIQAIQTSLAEWYLWLKALHVICVISWMAGLLYLPRLFVYHAENYSYGKEITDTFTVMEYRLLHYIMTPAMIASWVFGISMLMAGFVDWSQVWPWVKAVLVIAMSGFHGLLARWQRNLMAGRNVHPALHYRIANEFPALLMIVIVIMAVAEPF